MKDLLIDPWQLIISRPHPRLAALCTSFSADAICRLYEVPLDTAKADILEYLKVKLPDLQDEPRLIDLAKKADDLCYYHGGHMKYIPFFCTHLSPAFHRKLFTGGSLSATLAPSLPQKASTTYFYRFPSRGSTQTKIRLGNKESKNKKFQKGVKGNSSFPDASAGKKAVDSN